MQYFILFHRALVKGWKRCCCLYKQHITPYRQLTKLVEVSLIILFLKNIEDPELLEIAITVADFFIY